MSMFQKVADWIQSLKTPVWLKDILQMVQDVLVQVAMQIGQSYIEAIEKRIMEVSENTKWTNREKFMDVFNYARKNLKLSDISDSGLNLLIEGLFSKLKAQKTV